LLRRKIAQALMGTVLIVEIDPVLSCVQKGTQAVIRSALCYGQLKDADEVE
jgi:hypothetical protein